MVGNYGRSRQEHRILIWTYFLPYQTYIHQVGHVWYTMLRDLILCQGVTTLLWFVTWRTLVHFSELWPTYDRWPETKVEAWGTGISCLDLDFSLFRVLLMVKCVMFDVIHPCWSDTMSKVHDYTLVQYPVYFGLLYRTLVNLRQMDLNDDGTMGFRFWTYAFCSTRPLNDRMCRVWCPSTW